MSISGLLIGEAAKLVLVPNDYLTKYVSEIIVYMETALREL